MSNAGLEKSFVWAVAASFIAAALFAVLAPLAPSVSRFLRLQIEVWQAAVLMFILVLVGWAWLAVRPYFRGAPNLNPHSRFGKRMRVSAWAKKSIARHCAKSDFWRSREVVFVESGTLPVYLVWELYHQSQPKLMPKLLLTNNLFCTIAAMSARATAADGPLGHAEIVFPEDNPIACIQMGGLVLDDYAGTLPESLFHIDGDNAPEVPDICTSIDSYLKSKEVNHVVMMCTRLDPDTGPCAISHSMRLFKKLLLKYVAENKGTRLSILLEAEKLSGRVGVPVDGVVIPGHGDVRYWQNLLSQGQVNIIAASSFWMSRARMGLALREIKKMNTKGANAILLGRTGGEV